MKYIINWPQSAVNATPQYLYDHWTQIETLPFKGLIVFPSQFREVMSNIPITYQDVYINGKLGLLKTKIDTSSVKKNFLMAWGAKGPFDPFDNWSTCIENFRIYAKAAKDVGCLGILIDNEQYYGAGFHIWQYPQDILYANIHTEQEYRNQMRLRGNQIMTAMIGEFPNIKVMFAHGPYWSEPQAFSELPNVSAQIPAELRTGVLLGSFFSGFVEASQSNKSQNSSPKVIDGGEIYSSFSPSWYNVLSQSDYSGLYRNWRKTKIASTSYNSLHIPPSIRGSVWENNVDISYGLFSKWDNTPSNMQTHVEWSLNGCDEFIWFYNEDQDWYNNDPAVVSSLSLWKNAIETGLNNYSSSNNIVFNKLPAVGDSNWGTTLNNYLTQISPANNGGLNYFAQDPTTNPAGTAFGANDIGYTYINTATNQIKRYNGSSWEVLLTSTTASVTVNKWSGVKWAALGTSITAYNTYTKELNTIWNTTCQNLGVGGTSISSSAGAGPLGIFNKIVDIATDTELVTLEAGINDFRTNATLGTINDTTTATYYGALFVAVKNILNANNLRKVVLLTPFGNTDTNYPGTWNTPNSNGNTWLQFCDAMRQTAKRCGVYCCDIASDSQINGLSADKYMYDGIHLNAAGGLQYANTLNNFMQNVVR